MDRVVIIHTPHKDPASQWTVLVDEDMPIRFYDFRVLIEWLKDRHFHGRKFDHLGN